MNNENNIAPINEDLNVVKYETENITNLIYTIRGKQVMLDSDVAMLYHCETKYINRVVKRNIERFPEEFCFQVDEDELENMRCQFVTAYNMQKNEKYRNKKYSPYVFTEQGIAMLSALLKSEIAIKVSINIMKAFIEMRKFLIYNGQVFQEISTIKSKMLEHDRDIHKLFNKFEENKKAEFKQKIFFEGQIYDSYSLIVDIIKRSKEKIVIIDNYIDDTILKMLAKKNKGVNAVILTSEKSNISKLDIQKFNKEYFSLKVAKTDKFHDRFIVIDNKELYHCRCITKRFRKKVFCNF